MSKKLNKRQQRESEELAQLKSQQKELVQGEVAVEIEEEEEETVVNPFAAVRLHCARSRRSLIVFRS